MKKYIIVFLLVLVSCFIYAEDVATENVQIKGVFSGTERLFDVHPNDTLVHICSQLNIPIKKFKALLQVELDAYNKANEHEWTNYNREWDTLTISELGVTPERFKEAYTTFIDEKYDFGGNITIVGISVVFSSLFLIYLIIGLFKHIGKERSAPKDKKVQTPVGTVSGPAEVMSSDTIVAVITALHRYRVEIEERRKIMITIKRTQVSRWGSPCQADMPNKNITQPTRGRK